MEYATNAISASVIPSPLMSREKFAEAIGLPVGVVSAQIDKGYWPTVKVGKYSLINVALLQQQCLQKEGFSL